MSAEPLRIKSLLRVITLRRPSDFHVHLRQGMLMRAIALKTIMWALYAIIMPNHKPPLDSLRRLLIHKEELLALAEEHGYQQFTPLMIAFLTNRITPKVVERMAASGEVLGMKRYPDNKEGGREGTTGSGMAIPLRDSFEVYKAMEACDMLLPMHCESVYDKDGNELPHAEREAYFLLNELPWLLDTFPNLKIIVEHISTKIGCEIINSDKNGRLAATITPQHAMYTKSELNPHLLCMPIVKEVEDRDAVLKLMTSGHPRVFLGTDSAPHPSKTKVDDLSCCAFGCFTPHALSLYASVFEEMNALDKFEAFASLNGPRFYGLPEPGEDDIIALYAEDFGIPEPPKILNEKGEVEDIVIPLGYSADPEKNMRLKWRVELNHPQKVS